MRTSVWETALQTALRNWTKEAGGKVSIYICFLVKGEIHAIQHISFQKISINAGITKPLLVTRSSRHHEGFWCFSIYGEIQEGLIKSAPDNIYLKTCLSDFPQARTPYLFSPPELLSGVLRVSSSSYRNRGRDGKCRL